MRAVLLTLAACGGSSSAPPATVGPPAPLQATRAGADDVIVAQVDGRPVWGSCVAAQAKRGARRDEALHQCIDFELMAQAAEQRGLATDPEVIRATRTALVSQLVALAYEDTHTKPADFGELWNGLVAKNIFRIQHVDYRASAYVRVPLPDKPKPSPEAEAAAHALADQLAAAVAPERGLLGPQLFDLAKQALPGHPMVPATTDAVPPGTLEIGEVPPYRDGGLEEHYGDALFAITEIGRASPAVRTQYGWDVIVWTGDEPELTPTPDEITRDMLPDVKRTYFTVWVNQIAHDLGIHVDLVKDNIAKLEGMP